MKKSKRKFSKACVFILSMTLLFLSILMSACSASSNDGSSDLKVIDATNDFYINDFAKLFTEEQKSDMMKKAVTLDQEYSGIQVVVTTVESLTDCIVEGNKNKSLEQISHAMYNQYGIGKDSMGILILFSSGDRDIRIETGAKMQIYITDSKSGRLLDNYGMDYFRNNQFAEGLISLQDAVISEIQNAVSQEWNASGTTEISKEPTDEVAVNASEIEKNNNQNEKTSGEIVKMFIIIFEALLLIGLIVYFMLSLSSLKKKLKEVEDERENDQKRNEQRINSINSVFQQEKDREQREYSRRIQELSLEKENIQQEKRSISSKLQNLEERLTILQDKYSRIQRLYPDRDFEAEINNMIESEFKAEAFEIDAKISGCEKMSADKDRIKVFDNAISIYNSTDPNIKKYLTTDIKKLQTLYEESVTLQKEYERVEKIKRDKAIANKAYDEIRGICEGINVGTYENYDDLNRAYCIYSQLTSDQRKYIGDKLIYRIETLFKYAKEDYENMSATHDAEREIHRIIDRMYSGEEDDIDDLERAMRYYKCLSSVQKNYFDDSLLRKLKRLIDEAEEDHRVKERRREDDERRRREQLRRDEERRRQSHSSSSFGSSSHNNFGGHGGHSSGGGASRHF